MQSFKESYNWLRPAGIVASAAHSAHHGWSELEPAAAERRRDAGGGPRQCLDSGDMRHIAVLPGLAYRQRGVHVAGVSEFQHPLGGAAMQRTESRLSSEWHALPTGGRLSGCWPRDHDLAGS